MASSPVSFAPAASYPADTMGTLMVGALQVTDIEAARSVLMPNDGTRRDLTLATNAVDGSAIVLGAWAPTAGATADEEGAVAGTVQPVVTVTAGSVTVAQPVTAGTIAADAITANSLSDGVATLSNGVLSNVTLGAVPAVYIGDSWRITIGDRSSLVMQSTRDGGRTWVTRSTTRI